MEKARVRQRRLHFQALFEDRSSELRETLATQLASGSDAPKNAWSQARLVLKRQYELGELCAEYDEFGLASMYFQQVQTGIEAAQPTHTTEGSDEDTKEALALRLNALNWLAVMHFRAGAQNEAMKCLLEARNHREDASSERAPMDKSLTVNFALFLHAKGEVAEAENAAQSVVGDASQDPTDESNDDSRARSAAFLLLASICKAKGKADQALEYAERAVNLADRVQDPRLISRAHNNLGIYCLELSDVERAFGLFRTAFRATQQTKDFEQQAIVKYHLGLTLAYLGNGHSGKNDFYEFEGEDDEKEEKEEQDCPAEEPEAVDEQQNSPSDENSSLSAIETAVVTIVPEPHAKTPKDLFLESEKLTGALPDPDQALRVLAHSCRGEEEYYAGEFHTAEAEFAIALGQLRDFAGSEIGDDKDNTTTTEAAEGDATNRTNPAEPDESETTLPPIQPEIAKLQGLLLSYTGCTQLVEGKFGLAEHSHKKDLALALRQEDLHAQHRALRNLAIAYNATQRYIEAIPLWREALELAVVLDFKGEQLMAYSGLGSALREVLMLEGPSVLEAAGLDSTAGSMQPLQIFTKQRTLAEQANDLHQQILAQRHIVSVYESPIVKPQTDQEATETLERRLAECDALVNLCERYENLQYRADAYRSLANALTSQLARLRARAGGDGSSHHYGLADAIEILTEKRNSVCDSYQQANVELSTAAALMFQDVEQQDDDLHLSKPKPEERHARPPLTRLEILQRR